MNRKRDDKQDEFELFLSKVKEVGSIINDISSPDFEISKGGIEKASQYLQNSVERSEEMTPDEDGIVTVYSRSSLNRKALEDNSKPQDFSRMNPEEFMAAVEQDAKERHERKNMQNMNVS